MINFNRGEDRAKIYIGLLLVGVISLFLLSGISSSLFSVMFSAVPIGETSRVETDNLIWEFKTAPYAYAVVYDEIDKYGGTYKCNNGVISYVNCWQASGPDWGYKPDSWCPHPSPELICQGGCNPGREGRSIGYPPGTSASENDIKGFLCNNYVPDATFEKINTMGINVKVYNKDGLLLQGFAPDAGPADYYNVFDVTKFEYGGNIFNIGSINGGLNYFDAKLSDGRCTYKLCFGQYSSFFINPESFPLCSDFITGVSCTSGLPITQPGEEVTEPGTGGDGTGGDGTGGDGTGGETPPSPPEITPPPTEHQLCYQSSCETEKVTMCHNGNDICIHQSSIQDHLDIGDTCGSCPRDSYGCLEESELWCSETNECIGLGEICEDGIIDAPPYVPEPGQPTPPPVKVPSNNCGYEESYVCGTNGVTYLNDCWRKAYKATKGVDGPCGVCGNDYKELGEECDYTKVDKQCKDFGFLDEGYVSCNDDCTLNTVNCRNAVCGDGTTEGKESWLNCCLDTGCPSPNFNCVANVCKPKSTAGVCLDGTITNFCSENYDGYFCTSEGVLVEDCIQCGGCESVTCYEGQTSCESETYTLSKCFNNQFVEVSNCEYGCKDELQCNSGEIETIGGKGKSVAKKLAEAFIPDYPKETTVTTAEGVRPKTGDEILNEWITYKNIILASMLLIIILIARDTITGKIKWSFILNKLKKRFA